MIQFSDFFLFCSWVFEYGKDPKKKTITFTFHTPKIKNKTKNKRNLKKKIDINLNHNENCISLKTNAWTYDFAFFISVVFWKLQNYKI